MTKISTNIDKYLESIGNPYGKTRPNLAKLAYAYEPGLVSIIIPCYNNESFVGEAIESALFQNYEPKEVIVIDDGSTDNSLEVIKCYGDRIVWQAKQNAGAPAARNDGLELAKGEFIQFLDADDFLTSESLSERVELLQANRNFDAIVGRKMTVDEQGNVLARAPKISHIKHFDIYYIATNNTFTSCPLHRRYKLYTIGGFDESLPASQEADLHLRLILNDALIIPDSTFAYYYREHASNYRIHNIPWWNIDPYRHLSIALHKFSLIAQTNNVEIDQDIRNHLAQIIWNYGRALVSHGKFQPALKYFDHAKQLAPSCDLRGKIAKKTSRFMGSIPSEFLHGIINGQRQFLKNIFSCCSVS